MQQRARGKESENKRLAVSYFNNVNQKCGSEVAFTTETHKLSRKSRRCGNYNASAYVSAMAKSLLQLQVHFTVPAMLRHLIYPSRSDRIEYIGLALLAYTTE